MGSLSILRLPVMKANQYSSMFHWAVSLGVAIFFAMISPTKAHAQDGPNPRLPSITLQAGIHLINAEVASEVGTRAKGLMHRTKLGNNQGMLFIFEQKAQHCFWMRNTLIPLSIAFLEDDGTILNIENMQPKSDDSHCPLKAIRYALEMDQGWFAKKGISAGDRLGAKGLFSTKP
jgi:uncharacterized protein